MRTASAAVFAALGLLTVGALVNRPSSAAASTGTARTGDIRHADGTFYRYFVGYGYRFHPLLSFTELNRLVSAHDARAARRLASALLARGVRKDGALYWQYDFPYGGGPAPWTSGFVQAVAAQALARTAELLDDESFLRPADAAFRALRASLVMTMGGGLWVREYGFSTQAILNAQLQSVISLESYARIVRTPSVRHAVSMLYRATRTLLPRFDLGCWSRYSLGGAAAGSHYHAYHLDLLDRLSKTHPEDGVWRAMYSDWSRCL